MFIDTLRSIAPWAPIPLFAENLRAQHELVSAIMTRHSISACLTGCVRDFQRLWTANDVDIFGDNYASRPLAVASRRHGNVFDLVNSTVLEVGGIVRRRQILPARVDAPGPGRPTTVYLSFITPFAPPSDRGSLSRVKWWAGIVILFLEIVINTAVAILIYPLGMGIGTALFTCISLSTTIIFGLRLFVNPQFGNASAVEKDRVHTARDGAALDVHVVTESWNSSEFVAICGYSSQLHALTNISIRIKQASFLMWSCRGLAVVLTVQASLLAATTNTEGNERWSSLLWLCTYLLIYLLKMAFMKLAGPENILEKQPGMAYNVEPLHFSSRRSALVFMSMLPVSEKVNRWTWWDPLMPDNERRRSFCKELESSNAFNEALNWQKSDFKLINCTRSSGVDLSFPLSSVLNEAVQVFRSPTCAVPLQRYLDVVLPNDESNRISGTV